MPHIKISDPNQIGGTYQRVGPSHDHPVAPQWLITKNRNGTPFSPETQRRLAKLVQHEPKLLAAIAYLQENVAPNTKEWGLVQQFCRDASRQLLESHEYFVKANECKIEKNLLILGAYAQDYSLAAFFQDYRQRTDKSSKNLLTPNESFSYAEAIRMVVMVAEDIQPRTLVNNSDIIYRSQLHIGNPEMVMGTFERIAEKHPSLILAAQSERKHTPNEESQGLFGEFPNRSRIFAIAEEAYKTHSPRTPLETSWAAQINLTRRNEAEFQRLGVRG